MYAVIHIVRNPKAIKVGVPVVRTLELERSKALEQTPYRHVRIPLCIYTWNAVFH